MKTMDYTLCTHCHICQNNCDFLSKYGLDIGDVIQLKKLAYHCFQCGRCTAKCPVGIDGKAIMLSLRQERVRAGDDSIITEKYKGLIDEKADYKFRNYRHAHSGAVFFPGCSLIGMYPKTTQKLAELFECAGIGTVYDCCGKPIGEIGMNDKEHIIREKLEEQIRHNEITELIVACPSCKFYLEGKLKVKVTGIYEKLIELGIGRLITKNVKFFMPCPDRAERIWIDEIKHFIDGSISFLEEPQCCGLGGCATINEPELSHRFGITASQVIKEKFADAEPYVYCASCGGMFVRHGIRGVNHILSEIIGVDEVADAPNAYRNRVMSGKL